MKEFKCKDAGHACEWKVRAEKPEQIIREAREHGKRAHGLADPRSEEILPLIHDVATDWSEPLMFSPAVLKARGPDANPVDPRSEERRVGKEC